MLMVVYSDCQKFPSKVKTCGESECRTGKVLEMLISLTLGFLDAENNYNDE